MAENHSGISFVTQPKNLQLLILFSVKAEMLRELQSFLYYLVYYSMIYIFPLAFIFFLVFTIALKERDTKFKIREITQNLFKKLF